LNTTKTLETNLFDKYILSFSVPVNRTIPAENSELIKEELAKCPPWIIEKMQFEMNQRINLQKDFDEIKNKLSTKERDIKKTKS